MVSSTYDVYLLALLEGAQKSLWMIVNHSAATPDYLRSTYSALCDVLRYIPTWLHIPKTQLARPQARGRRRNNVSTEYCLWDLTSYCLRERSNITVHCHVRHTALHSRVSLLPLCAPQMPSDPSSVPLARHPSGTSIVLGRPLSWSH